MSRSSRSDRSPGSDPTEAASPNPRREALRREVWGIALLLFAVFLGGALIAEGVAAIRGADFRSSFGWAGSLLAAPLLEFFGWPAAALLPIAAGAHALRQFGRLGQRTDRLWMGFLLGLVLLVPIALGIIQALPLGEESVLAGIWGSIGGRATTLTGEPLVPSRLDLAEEIDATFVDAKPSLPLAALLEPPPETMPEFDPSLLSDTPKPDAVTDTAEPRKKRERKPKSAATAENDERVAAAIGATEHDPISLGDDELPSPELLTPPPPRNADTGKRELDAMGVKLMDALRTFKVEGELVDRTVGPVVTQFEIAPAAGVKVRQIANLSNDLALAMRAQSIRIVAPIPGKGAVGVEVPNPAPEIVAFRELLESADYKGPRALPIALGKDLQGKPVIADLAKMPHLLIAGATGSGKSVCINTLITSLVYRHTPRTLRLLMVDPKMVERDAAAVLKWAVMEMQYRYELLAANGARNIQDFNRKVHEGAPLKAAKSRDVAFQNEAYEGDVLPYIVLVIDELADLMMTVQGEVETPLAMLAQKARAIGIHLILATQRPSVNVITGLIKANFPSRIAFRVASQVDSRTILDGIGAESLLGNGDMLFIPPAKSEPARLQGAFISSEDTERLMGWYTERREARRKAWEEQGLIVDEKPAEPDILETVRLREAEESGAADGDGADDSDRDKLFREAAEVVIQHQQGSTSLLQRRLKVGYGRAARIIDQLHAAGILGPPDGSKPRDVLAGLDDLDRIAGPRSL